MKFASFASYEGFGANDSVKFKGSFNLVLVVAPSFGLVASSCLVTILLKFRIVFFSNG